MPFNLLGWTTLFIEHPKVLFSILSLIVTLVSGNIGQYFYGDEMAQKADSFEQGYNIVAENVNKSTSRHTETVISETYDDSDIRQLITNHIRNH